MNRLPARIDTTVSRFGVHVRELVILGGGILALLLSVVLFVHQVLLGVFVGLVLLSLSVVYAFWRVGGVWPIEQYILHILWFRSRNRHYIKDGAPESSLAAYARAPAAPTPEAQEDALFYLPAALSPRSNLDLLFKVGVFWLAVVLVVGMAWAMRDVPAWRNTVR